MIGSDSMHFSGSQFRFVVEALNNASGNLSFCPKPVQQQWPMFPQTASNILHRFNLRTHGFGAPFIQKPACPVAQRKTPEKLKLFFQKVAPDQLQIVPQKLRQLSLLFFRQILRTFQQQPAAVCQHWSYPFALSSFASYARTLSIVLLNLAMM